VGAPPPEEWRVPLADWDRPPWNRWAFQHVSELLPTACVRRGSPTPSALARAETPIEAITFEPVSGGASWPVVWRYIIQHWRIYCAFLLGVPFIVVLLYGLQAWVPTFLVRVYEWDIPRAGRTYGMIALLAVIILGGGYVATDLAAAKDDPETGKGQKKMEVIEFDVAEDMTRFVMDEAPVYEESGLPAHGNPFVTVGYIYPKGTLDGSNGVLADGQPAFPDKVIGKWVCRGADHRCP